MLKSSVRFFVHHRQTAQATKVACDDGKQKSYRVNRPLRNHVVMALRTRGKNVIGDQIVLITQQKHFKWQEKSLETKKKLNVFELPILRNAQTVRSTRNSCSFAENGKKNV